MENFKKSLIPDSLFLALISSFFLAVGVDSPGHNIVREIFSGISIAVSLLFFWRLFSLDKLKSFSLIAFAVFLLFELVRAGLFYFHGITLPEHMKAPAYLHGAVLWGLYFFGFAAAYFCLSRRSILTRFLYLNAAVCFLLSVNTIFPLAKTGNMHYAAAKNFYSVFYPAFYVQPWVGKYVLAVTSHPNRMGDILAIGMFAALGILFYQFLQFKARIKNAITYEAKPSSQEWSLFALLLTFALTSGAVILLLFSRGTIVCVAIVFMLSFIAKAVKFPSKTQWFFLAAFLGAMFLFFSWAGDLQKAWKEVRTLKEEQAVVEKDLNKEIYKSKSMYVNQEGSRRALRIYHKYSPWGIGTNGYRVIAKYFSSKGDYERLALANFTAMNHYIQLLAEEGVGAYLYYLFLLTYLVDFSWGMYRTKSQFKFLAALSLAAPAISILAHASINDLMQRFTIAMPVYLLMGASLAALRKDFDHHA